MKYKLITIFIILFLILGCVYVDVFYKKELSYVYHQHLEDSNDESGCVGIDDCSHLPIVNINTNNQTVPFESKDVLSDEIDYIISNVEIYDNGDKVNYLGGDKTSLDARIRYRGRSSLRFDKKGYLLKFVNDKNEKVNESFLGMPSDSDWVLHGPFIDKTLIRNYMWYNIGQEIMGEAPKTRLLELYLNSEYQGLYLAVESVSQSENSRVKMESIRDDSIVTSYLIQLDSDVLDESTHLNSFSEYAHKIDTIVEHPIYLSIKYPDVEELNDDVKKYIYDDFAEFEKMLYSLDYKEYSKYIDIDSFVDYFIINEFTQNYDALKYSTYIYKDLSGKYKMYMWDFNLANNIYSVDFFVDESQSFQLANRIWYVMLLKDEDFVNAVIDRYNELRKTYLSEEYLYDYINSTIEYLGPVIDRNFDKWGYTFDSMYNTADTHFHPRNYEEAVVQLKDSIKKRSEWLDINIYNLRQYCHESKNKKYNN